MIFKDVLNFCFESITPDMWWKKDATFDRQIADQFLALHHKTKSALLSCWRESAEGALAEIIILDQFSRNIYRDQPESFQNDGMALALAQEAIRRNLNGQLSPEHKIFMYLPFMHSESYMIHETALELFAEPGLEENLNFEKAHAQIIKQFGRYPHRNRILGRPSTKQELAYLKDNPGF